MDDAKKNVENDWIPLLAGAQMIVRLGPHGTQVHWPKQVKVEANRQLLDALQSGRIMSVGYYRMFDGVWPISAKEWISLRPLISKNRLTTHGPILRPQFRPDDIDDIEVNAVDIKREFANEPSMVTLEQPPSEGPPARSLLPASRKPPIGRYLAGEEISKEARKDPLITDDKRPELFTLKPTFMGMSLDLKVLFRRAKAWWKRKK